MNERIKQLLGQAYDEAVPETWTTLSSEQLGRVYDKFAELIIKECAMIVEGFEITQEVALDEYVDYEASDVLKKHFGVEE